MNKFLAFVSGTGFTAWGLWIVTTPIRDPNFIWHGGWVMLMLLFGFFIFVGFQMIHATLPSGGFWVWALVMIALGGVFAFWNRDFSGIDKTAAQVCGAQGVAEAAPYTKTGGVVHPLVVVYKANGRGYNPSAYPKNWKAKSGKDLELVACLEEEWLIVETCRYGSGFSSTNATANVERRQHLMTAYLYEAKTGKQVDTVALKGGVPRECMSSESFSDNQSLKVVEGTSIAPTDLFNQLEKWVAP